MFLRKHFNNPNQILLNTLTDEMNSEVIFNPRHIFAIEHVYPKAQLKMDNTNFINKGLPRKLFPINLNDILDTSVV